MILQSFIFEQYKCTNKEFIIFKKLSELQKKIPLKRVRFTKKMQKLFYVVCRWLEEDNSRQSTRISDIIKQEMEQAGFNFESISGTQRQRQELYRERQKLIRQKERLQEQKRQIQQEREHNLKLIEEKEKLQRQKEEIQDRLNREKNQTDGLRGENEELEEKRKTMVEEYHRLQQERDKIIEERQVLYDRMEKIEKLQRLQRMYQQELRRLREQAQAQGQIIQEEKTNEQEHNEMKVELPPNQQLMSTPQTRDNNHYTETAQQVPTSQQNSFQTHPVQYSPGFSSVSSKPRGFNQPVAFNSYNPHTTAVLQRFRKQNKQDTKKQQSQPQNHYTQKQFQEENQSSQEKPNYEQNQ